MQTEEFVAALVGQSECNLMCLHRVLAEIERGAYQKLGIERLPTDLRRRFEHY